MSKICDYVYCKGNDVICGKTNKILGDIIGYDGCNYRNEKGLKSEVILIKYVKTGMEKLNR